LVAKAFVPVLLGASKASPCCHAGIRHAPARQTHTLGDRRCAPCRTLGALHLSGMGEQRAMRRGGRARQGVPEDVGFDIEVKLATPDNLAATPAAEVERMVAPILAAVRSPAHAAPCAPMHPAHTHPSAARSPRAPLGCAGRAPPARRASSPQAGAVLSCLHDMRRLWCPMAAGGINRLWHERAAGARAEGFRVRFGGAAQVERGAARSRRAIFFSSFDPDVCRCAAL